MAEQLMKEVGKAHSMDFNDFQKSVDAALKKLKIKLTASEKKQILNAVSWREETAARVIKKIHKFNSVKLDELLTQLDIAEQQLPDYGYWPINALSPGERANEYIE